MYDRKGYPLSKDKTTFMPKSLQHIRLWTDFDENLNANIMKRIFFHKCPFFYVMEKFWDFLLLDFLTLLQP
jgi:hypothetical protein